MFSWSELYARHEHVNDLRRQADRERRARQLLSNDDQRPRFNDRLLAGLGSTLIAWGCRLTERTREATSQLASNQPSRVVGSCACPEGRYSFGR